MMFDFLKKPFKKITVDRNEEVNGTDVLLALLYANGDKGQLNEEVWGFTRIDKLLFLLSKSPEFKGLIDFEFDSGRFGVYSIDAFDMLEALIIIGAVEETVVGRAISVLTVGDEMEIDDQCEGRLSLNAYSHKTYKISKKGLAIAKPIWEKLSKSQKKEIIYFKTWNLSLPRLITYLYHKYPVESGIQEIRDSLHSKDKEVED